MTTTLKTIARVPDPSGIRPEARRARTSLQRCLSEADRRLTTVGRVEVNVNLCQRRVQAFLSRATGEVASVFVASAPLG